MSQEFFDPELFADFIAEAKEHLETIEPNLLELEKAPDNLALLNDIFRPMHSLKGASGFLGLNRINQLAHKSENILDELRKGTMVVTSEIMDVILASTDALRNQRTTLFNFQQLVDTFDSAQLADPTLNASAAASTSPSPIRRWTAQAASQRRTAGRSGTGQVLKERCRTSTRALSRKRSASCSAMYTERCWPPVQPMATVR